MNNIRDIFSSAKREKLQGKIVGCQFEKESNLRIVTVKTDDNKTFSAISVNFQGFYNQKIPTETDVKFCFTVDGFSEPVAIVTE